jgi:hypothetical protein
MTGINLHHQSWRDPCFREIVRVLWTQCLQPQETPHLIATSLCARYVTVIMN